MPKFEGSSYLIVSEEYRPSQHERFPYTTLFASESLRIFTPSDEDLNVAKAGVDNLRPFLDTSIDLDKNYDLLGVAFNAFVVNAANKNGQVISTETALSCVDNFKYKSMNIEHRRGDVVGLITGYGFSEFGTDKPLTLEEVTGASFAFNVVLSGFVWRVVNKDFALKLEESSDPDSPSYLAISTSWEMGFKDYAIARGSKNPNEAEIITEPEQVEELKSGLLHFGGKGTDKEGQDIYILLQGEVLPLGIGFTLRPAADVRGVKTASENDDLPNNKKENEGDDTSLSSQIEKTPVTSIIYLNFERDTNQQNNPMLIKSINDLTDDSLKQVSATDVRALFEEEIKKANDKFVAEKNEKDNAVAEALKANEALKADVEATKTKNEELSAEIAKIKEAAASKEAEDTFQARMGSLDEEFSLEDEDRQAIGEQIRDLDGESFDKWYKSFSVFAKAKNKAFMDMIQKKKDEKAGKTSDKSGDESKEAKSKCGDKKAKASEENEEANASEEDDAAKVAADAAAAAEEAAKKALEAEASKDAALANAGSGTTPTLKDRFAKAFTKDSVKVEIK